MSPTFLLPCITCIIAPAAVSKSTTGTEVQKGHRQARLETKAGLRKVCSHPGSIYKDQLTIKDLC